MSRKSVSTNNSEILIDLRSKSMFQMTQQQALPKNLLEKSVEKPKKITKTKIRRQPGDMINLKTESPESPRRMVMDFS